MEDDRSAVRGEFDCQQGWRMTAGQEGVNDTASGRGMDGRQKEGWRMADRQRRGVEIDC